MHHFKLLPFFKINREYYIPLWDLGSCGYLFECLIMARERLIFSEMRFWDDQDEIRI